MTDLVINVLNKLAHKYGTSAYFPQSKFYLADSRITESSWINSS